VEGGLGTGIVALAHQLNALVVTNSPEGTSVSIGHTEREAT
jgi:hypothetical protein